MHCLRLSSKEALLLMRQQRAWFVITATELGRCVIEAVLEEDSLIRLARQVEVGKGAVDVWRHHLAGGADIGFVELVVAGDAQ
jgi:hypothetical protein